MQLAPPAGFGLQVWLPEAFSYNRWVINFQLIRICLSHSRISAGPVPGGRSSNRKSEPARRKFFRGSTVPPTLLPLDPPVSGDVTSASSPPALKRKLKLFTSAIIPDISCIFHSRPDYSLLTRFRLSCHIWKLIMQLGRPQPAFANEKKKFGWTCG